ncbi:MarR family winged helix-turn-helix transcriptional regulator [Micromonospora soli]|uniref:MarR family winged helix-turn-helix transcriptional regulator n=1 Tax=Micromonospora sp. NBRC 110009 TaxID=3061627 RepID=UPI002671D5C3|nr:MarR family winged helix-turn-helix transcriptional regulator [Micromonospora sp. NBRC 110009]WKT99880.1 MarR family winged helix-turn-helix transcriptional regulator [Micromonospora sp. NBRC 110009]
MSTVTPPPAPTPEGPKPLNPDEEAVVRSLTRVIYALPRAIDAEMVREQRLPLIEYLVLMHLSEAPDRQLRMSELATACEMSLSGMSRAVQKLEGQGYVERARCADDARGWNAVLTDAGFARLSDAWPSHLAAVRRHFLDHLAGLDLKKVAAALENVAT